MQPFDLKQKNPKIQVMGILNVTLDSFSDGGEYLHPQAGLAHAQKMLQEGANWIDIGGESTRPNANEVSEQEELDRVIPMIELILKEMDCQISVDTSKPKVMYEAFKAGAKMINDVRSLQLEGALEVAVQTKLPVCLMHMLGSPKTMQTLTDHYQQPIEIEVAAFLKTQIERCVAAGIDRHNIILDPGFGFAKSVQDNYRLLAKLETLQTFNLPLLVGLSRKSMLGEVLNLPAKERIFGSVSAAVIAAMKGAQFIRVHDVKATVEALKIVEMTSQFMS